MPEVEGELTLGILAERIRGLAIQHRQRTDDLETRLTEREATALKRYDELRESILRVEKQADMHHHSNSNGKRGWRQAQSAIPMTGGGAGLGVLIYEIVRLVSGA